MDTPYWSTRLVIGPSGKDTRRADRHDPVGADRTASAHAGSALEPRVAVRRVYLAGPLTAMQSPGGGEIQMLSLALALQGLGIDARPWRPWEDTFRPGDCLHLFGSLPQHLDLVAGARRRQARVVLSPIAWFDLANCWREPKRLSYRLMAASRFLLRAAVPGVPSWRRRLYHSVDRLLPNSTAEAQQLMRYFGVPAARILVTPNGAHERFAEADPELFRRRFGLDRFVLYPGRIEPRKNQLGFLRAMRGSPLPIVVLGDPVPGQEAYARACRAEAGPHVHFLGRIEHDDPLLAGAYAACRCLVLASWFETPGLVALEAGMCGTPLVLPEAGCAKEYFGPHAIYVRPGDPAGIRRATEAAFAGCRSEDLARHVLEHFSWRRAARITAEAYEAPMAEARGPAHSRGEKAL